MTRAVSDGSNIDILYYEVYGDNVETAAAPIFEGAINDTNAEGNFVMTVSLIKDVEYNFVFWAQVDGCTHYDVTDLRKVKINDYADAKSNDESRAAFFAFEKIKVTGPSDKNIAVILKRPFSQINFGTTTYDNAGAPLRVSTSGLEINKIADKFNTLTGQGEGENSVVFDSAPTPNGKRDELEKLLETNDSDYYWIGMNYLIVCGNQDAVTVDAYFATNKGEVHINVPNVSIRPNYRTNIIGNLLTSHTEFEVVVDEDFFMTEENLDEDGNKLD